MSTPTVFICYSSQDDRLKKLVEGQLSVLKPQGILETWSDQDIGAGEDWLREIQRAIERARVAILLISHHFLTSNFILNEEVPKLLQRRNKEGLKVVPILLSDCAWEGIAWLAKMQIRPDPKKPLTSYSGDKRNRALKHIVQEVRSFLDSPDDVKEPTTSSQQGQSETLSEVRKELKKLASEQIRDDEDDVPKPLLLHLHRSLRCEFDPEPSELQERLAVFLIEYRPYTPTGLDKVYCQACEQGLRRAASVLHNVFQLVVTFQLPGELWSLIEKQHSAGSAVLANAAPGVVFAEAVAARIHGKPAVVSLDGEVVKVPMRLGPFPIDHPPPGHPEGTSEFLLREIYRGAQLESGGMAVADMLAYLLGFLQKWQQHHGRSPYIVVKLPTDPDDRTNYERVLTEIKGAVKHVHFLGYYTDPTALGVEGGLRFLLQTHYDSERKWKTP